MNVVTSICLLLLDFLIYLALIIGPTSLAERLRVVWFLFMLRISEKTIGDGFSISFSIRINLFSKTKLIKNQQHFFLAFLFYSSLFLANINFLD